MKALRAIDGQVRLVDEPEPRGDGVVVTIRSAGICGSDLHLLDGGMLTVIPGHELAGTTPDGAAVAIEPLLSCGTCAACLDHREPHCPTALENTMGIGVDGGMAERVVVDPRFLVPLAPGVSVDDACLVEPLAVAVRALGRAGVAAGQRVVVIGGGPIGLCAVAVARWLGAQVELVARHDHQRGAGERLGAGPATDRPAPIVIDAAGTQSALDEAVQRCDRGGTVGVAATYWEPVTLPGLAMGLGEISLVPSVTYGHTTGPRDVEVSARILAEVPHIARVLITHRFPLDAGPEAFAAARDRVGGARKVVLDPSA